MVQAELFTGFRENEISALIINAIHYDSAGFFEFNDPLFHHKLKRKIIFALLNTVLLLALIKSISGIRGTIGGKPGDGLTPPDIVKFTAAFGTWLIGKSNRSKKVSVVIGRDARISGEMVQNIVAGTLKGLGIDVIYL